MAADPFTDAVDYRRYVREVAQYPDRQDYAVIDRDADKAVGTLSLMRQDPNNGVIEVGNVMFSPLLKRTPISTEAQFRIMAYLFDDLGYRRYEWKCDSLNAPSRNAAQRLGFRFEGIFRQAMIYKGRSRGTAWYSIIDADWPTLRQAFQEWLAPDNFTIDGRQRRALSEIRAQVDRHRRASRTTGLAMPSCFRCSATLIRRT